MNDVSKPVPPKAEPPNTRSLAARIVARWLSTDVLPDRLLDEAVADRGFAMDLVYGIVKRRRGLEWALGRLAKREPTGILRAYLMVGLYQVLHMPEVQDYAVVHATVDAVKADCSAPEAGFVNAVLRRAFRERAALLEALAAEPLGVRESHPDVLVTRWVAAWDDARAEALCRWNNQGADVTLRLNVPRQSMADFLKSLRAAGIEAAPHSFRPAECVTLPHGVSVSDVPGFREGRFAVQDPSTLVAVDLLDPHPGDRVLDACAAPGGKTLAMAERMQGQGELVALDPSTGRLQRLRENLSRSGWSFVRVVAADLREHRVEDAARFDRVLLDVPCSNTGVLRRRPDARWRFALASLARRTAQQRALLDAAARCLRPGGSLVYSTCSLEADENEQLLGDWLRTHPRFTMRSERRLFPPTHGVDGAYAALLAG